MPPELFLGKNYREIMPPNVVEVTDRAMNDLFASGKPQQYEYSIDTGEGVKWFNSLLSIRKNDLGIVSGVVAVIRDITDRKTIEESLRKQKDFNEILIQNSPAFIVAIRSNGKTLMMNRSMLNALGYNIDEVTDRGYLNNFVPAEDHPGLSRIFSEIISERKNTLNINRVICKDGSTLTVEWRGMPVFKGEDFDFLIGIGFDVTEKLKTERSLRESEERYRTLVSNLNVGVYRNTPEPDSRYLHINPAMAKIFGYESVEEMKAGNVRSLYRDVDERRALFAKIKDRGSIKDQKIEMLKKDGSAVWVSVTAKAEFDENGDIKWIDGILEDITERKQMEDELLLRTHELQESEEKYRTLFEKSRDAMLIMDLYTFIDCNEASLDMLKLKNKDELTGKHPWEISPAFQPDGRSSEMKAKEMIDKASAGISQRFEWLHLRDEENEFWAEVTLTAIPFKNKQFIHVFWRDISERKRAEKALQDSERFFRVLADNIPGVAYQFFARKNGDVGFYYISEKSMEILGLENNTDTFLARATGAVSEEYREAFLRSIDEAIKNFSKWDFECKFIKPGGDAVWVRGISEPAIQGDEIIFNGVIIDITERKNAEKAMRLLNYSLDHVRDGIFWLDSNARLYYVNDAACSSLGYTREELIGMPIHDIDPDFPPEVWKPHLEELKAKGSITFESRHKTKDGRIFPVEVTGNYILFEGEEGSFAFVSDISRRKHAEEQLRQAQKMETVGTLAGGLAHDFNNILSGITGPLSLIDYKLEKNRDIKPEVLREYFRMMYDSSMRAADIIQQLLSLSRKHDYAFTSVDLNASISNVIKICSNSFDKSIELKTVCPSGEAPVLGDATQIEQVLLNMCVNAAHAMTVMRDKNEKWGGTLSVSLEKIKADPLFKTTHPEASGDEFWLITITDTGIGITRDAIHRIFDPFYTTKEKGTGTGLGLSIVYTIIRQHRGFIEVYSEEGTGSSFRIYLPFFNDKYAVQRKTDSTKAIIHGEGTILVIDDEKTIRLIVKEFLEECGYVIIAAENARDGIEIFKSRYPEIKAVFLDMSMPEISGRDVYIMLKQIYPGVKVLLSSGFRQDNRVEELLVMGVNGFIQKPLTIEKLSEAIHRVIYSS
jgi:PAS domain S-box-containing protein